MREPVSSADYDKAFDVSKPPTALVDGKQARALAHALDIRKFEIQLYWTRAAYFWTFIGASLAAYGAVRTIPDLSTKEFLSDRKSVV